MRIRKALVCGFDTYECAHGDHWLNGSDVAALLASLATLREERDALTQERSVLRRFLGKDEEQEADEALDAARSGATPADPQPSPARLSGDHYGP
jgi:hypothetical protein